MGICQGSLSSGQSKRDIHSRRKRWTNLPAFREIERQKRAAASRLPGQLVNRETGCVAIPPVPCRSWKLAHDASLEVESWRLALYRWMRADPPLANARTWSTVAMVVSPGKVVSSAPCAQPSFTDSSGDSPVSKP